MGLTIFHPPVLHHDDARGVVARPFDKEQFTNFNVAEVVYSANRLAGTLRGLHYQLDEQQKLVTCLHGAIFDVVVDPIAKVVHSAALSACNAVVARVPAHWLHGFQTLEPDTVVLYLFSTPFDEPNVKGIRYNDPSLGIPWPLHVTVISDKDRQWPRI